MAVHFHTEMLTDVWCNHSSHMFCASSIDSKSSPSTQKHLEMILSCKMQIEMLGNALVLISLLSMKHFTELSRVLVSICFFKVSFDLAFLLFTLNTKLT